MDHIIQEALAEEQAEKKRRKQFKTSRGKLNVNFDSFDSRYRRGLEDFHSPRFLLTAQLCAISSPSPSILFSTLLAKRSVDFCLDLFS